VAFESADGAFLYYAKRGEEGKLWRIPVRGGEETQVLDAVEGMGFAVLAKGIYFIRPPEASSSPTLRFLSFETGNVRIIASIPHLAIYRGLSFSLRSRRYPHRRRVPPRVGFNVLDRGLSLAGLEVTFYGRFWVTPEALLELFDISSTVSPGKAAVD